MPYSFDYFKNDVKFHIMKNIPHYAKVLDVGAGSGKYGAMLRDYFGGIDALEIYHPYIAKFDLHSIYNRIFCADIMEFDISEFDYIILGDIIEHLTIENAQELLSYINNSGKKCVVAIPYEMDQDEVGGNKYEKHLQSDLTNNTFIDRYPYMKLLFNNELYGYYVNYEFI
jgi:protein-L-isoaspartate O-methyltransferase